ncbi:MAG: hypothetical protein CBE24_07740 [bacterium TMED264]|mgnify:CR=1 FL=1|nr:MAG: hypothetical protein CBE24_07740 [bacterium TMED264]|tara:strand:- start:4202 stop:4972 length:771 start_codon:yes stop_codon:yes gene_type:complete
MKKILVLGDKGMLGHMVKDFLSSKNDCFVLTTTSRWPNEDFKKIVKTFSYQNCEYIINCIGAIPQKVKSFNVNSELPIWLDDNIGQNSTCRIVHPGTDCEGDKDEYGLSKKRAADFLIKNGVCTKIIKTSVVGPELYSKNSLLEWFLNVDQEVIDGYSQFFWNGITTLQWSLICYDLIKNWNQFETLTIPASECISKFDLLMLVKNIFKKKIKIKKNATIKANKCLIGNLKVPPIEQQLFDLKKYIEDKDKNRESI